MKATSGRKAAQHFSALDLETFQFHLCGRRARSMPRNNQTDCWQVVRQTTQTMTTIHVFVDKCPLSSCPRTSAMLDSPRTPGGNCISCQGICPGPFLTQSSALGRHALIGSHTIKHMQRFKPFTEQFSISSQQPCQEMARIRGTPSTTIPRRIAQELAK